MPVALVSASLSVLCSLLCFTLVCSQLYHPPPKKHRRLSTLALSSSALTSVVCASVSIVHLCGVDSGLFARSASAACLTYLYLARLSQCTLNYLRIGAVFKGTIQSNPLVSQVRKAGVIGFATLETLSLLIVQLYLWLRLPMPNAGTVTIVAYMVILTLDDSISSGISTVYLARSLSSMVRSMDESHTLENKRKRSMVHATDHCGSAMTGSLADMVAAEVEEYSRPRRLSLMGPRVSKSSKKPRELSDSLRIDDLEIDEGLVEEMAERSLSLSMSKRDGQSPSLRAQNTLSLTTMTVDSNASRMRDALEAMSNELSESTQSSSTNKGRRTSVLFRNNVAPPVINQPELALDYLSLVSKASLLSCVQLSISVVVRLLVSLFTILQRPNSVGISGLSLVLFASVESVVSQTVSFLNQAGNDAYYKTVCVCRECIEQPLMVGIRDSGHPLHSGLVSKDELARVEQMRRSIEQRRRVSLQKVPESKDDDHAPKEEDTPISSSSEDSETAL